MTATILWSALATILLVTVGVAVVMFRARARVRQPATVALGEHPVDRDCAAIGHVYRFHGTGLRCARCGNHVARLDGEVYGRVEDGLIERRRAPR